MLAIEAIVLFYYLATARRFVKSFYKPNMSKISKESFKMDINLTDVSMGSFKNQESLRDMMNDHNFKSNENT